jgi:hypothetical protein
MPQGDFVWPDRDIAASEDIGDYLLNRPSVFGRPGFLSTSTILAPRSLFLKVPFENEADHEDWSFIIKACKIHGAPVVFTWKPLAIYNFNPDAVTRSRRGRWQTSYEWADKSRALLSRQAFASFLLSKVAVKAKNGKQYLALLFIFMEALLRGRPRLHHLLAFCGICFTPAGLGRRALRQSYGPRVAQD